MRWLLNLSGFEWLLFASVVLAIAVLVYGCWSLCVVASYRRDDPYDMWGDGE